MRQSGSGSCHSPTTIEPQPTVLRVYLRNDAHPADVNALRAYITSDPHVSGVLYVSRAEALQRYLRLPGYKPLIDTAPPALLEVSIPDSRNFSAVGDRLGQWGLLLKTVMVKRDSRGSLIWLHN